MVSLLSMDNRCSLSVKNNIAQSEILNYIRTYLKIRNFLLRRGLILSKSGVYTLVNEHLRMVRTKHE